MKKSNLYAFVLTTVLHSAIIMGLFLSKSTVKQIRYKIPYDKVLQVSVLTKADVIPPSKNRHRPSLTIKKINKESETKKKSSKSTTKKKLSGQKLNQLVVILYQSLLNHRVLPKHSLRLGHYGKVIVSFRLQPSGQVEKIVIKKSSGFSELDTAAITTLKNASPFKGVKKYLSKPETFSLPIDYH
jgi:TonB family protein